MIRYPTCTLKGVKCGVALHRAYTISIGNKMNSRSIDINEMKDINEMSASTFERLSKAYKLLSSRRRFRYSANDCYNLFVSCEASFLEDLMKYPRINQDMLMFLFMNYQKSNSVKALILNDLKSLVVDEKYEVVLETLNKMIECDIVSKGIRIEITHVSNNLSKYNSTKRKHILASLIVAQTASSGEHILASSFAISFMKSGIIINNQTLKLLLQSLAIDTTINHTYNAYTILKLFNTFSMKSIAISDRCNILSYLLEDRQSPFFANIFFDKYIINGITLAETADNNKNLNEVLSRLILKNLQHGNFHKALKIWIKMKEWRIKESTLNSMVVIKLVEASAQESSQDTENLILNHIPENWYTHEDVVDHLLKFFGTNPQHIDKFESLVKQLSPPLRRSTLSSLFEASLSQNKETGAERLLQSIFKSKNGINCNDFNVIITKLLKQNKMEQCIGMIQNTDIQISKLGYISVLTQLFRESSLHLRKDFLHEMAIKFRKLNKEDENLSLLTKELIRYVSTKISNRASRGLLTNIMHISSNTSLNQSNHKPLNLEKYSLPKDFQLLLSASSKTKVDCLKIILNQSIIDEDVETLKWCIDEMRSAGFLVQDILSLISKRNTSFLKNVISEEFLQCTD